MPIYCKARKNFPSLTQAVGFDGGTVEQSENQRKKQGLAYNMYSKTIFPSPAKTQFSLHTTR
jgi:hypothetical protein